MRYFKIEVDDKVWNYLKSQAEPFEDTPNSVLNRILFGTVTQDSFTKKLSESEGSEVNLPKWAPKALSQILEVIYEVRKFNRSRNEATNIVARRRGTAPQTVIDKYCRQLSKRAYEIDELLQEQDLEGFKSLLLTRFGRYQDIITSVFEDLQDSEKKDRSQYQKREAIAKETGKANKMYALNELKSLNLEKEIRPYQLRIDGDIIDVDDWTDVCKHFVERLIEKGFLTSFSTPIFNYSDTRQKYFINTKPKHFFPEMDGAWKQVGSFFVDTKYSAGDHIRNIVNTLNHLNVQDIDLGISFKN